MKVIARIEFLKTSWFQTPRKEAGPRHEARPPSDGVGRKLKQVPRAPFNSRDGDIGNSGMQKLLCRAQGVPQLCAPAKLQLVQRFAAAKKADCLATILADGFDVGREHRSSAGETPRCDRAIRFGLRRRSHFNARYWILLLRCNRAIVTRATAVLRI